ncbi:hypothetical protein Bmyc01_53160 [Bacillus mycoides]|nr:hypothetical protein Bmyc01_53160 [Bacillus mycoides]
MKLYKATAPKITSMFSGASIKIVFQISGVTHLISAAVSRVPVKKLQDNCNKSANLGHTDTTNLKKVRDWYVKGKCIQMETFST